MPKRNILGADFALLQPPAFRPLQNPSRFHGLLCLPKRMDFSSTPPFPPRFTVEALQ